MKPYGPAIRRDQRRIDAIGHLLNDNALLAVSEIHNLAHDLGDLEDAALTISEIFDRIHISLTNLNSAPRDCCHEIGSLRGWFDEFRQHMDSAEPLMEKTCKEIRQRYSLDEPEEN